jgi:hypothetical protein
MAAATVVSLNALGRHLADQGLDPRRGDRLRHRHPRDAEAHRWRGVHAEQACSTNASTEGLTLGTATVRGEVR